MYQYVRDTVVFVCIREHLFWTLVKMYFTKVRLSRCRYAGGYGPANAAEYILFFIFSAYDGRIEIVSGAHRRKLPRFVRTTLTIYYSRCRLIRFRPAAVGGYKIAWRRFSVRTKPELSSSSSSDERRRNLSAGVGAGRAREMHCSNLAGKTSTGW